MDLKSPRFLLKKKFLQLFITLDIVSWILFDLFVDYYADKLVIQNTAAKFDSEEYHELKVMVDFDIFAQKILSHSLY